MANGEIDSKVLLDLTSVGAGVYDKWRVFDAAELCKTAIDGVTQYPDIFERALPLIQDKVATVNSILGASIQKPKRRSDLRATKLELHRSQRDVLKDIGFDDCPTWMAEPLLRHTKFAGSSPTPEMFSLSLRDLKLIDPAKLSWEEILEFRKDKDARKALRDFRLFFSENFEGKDRGFITDRLEQLIDQQEAAAQIWGFETAQKTLSVAFENGTVIASSAGFLATAATTATLPVAAATALVIPLARCTLAFSRIALEATKARFDRPVRYLTQLKKLGK